MTGLVRKATFLAVCGLLTAGAAMAHVPSLVRECESDSFAIWGVSSKEDASHVSDVRCTRIAGQENATVLDR
jgi:hypothetical protein